MNRQTRLQHTRCKWRELYNNIRHGRVSNTGTSRSDKFIVIYIILL